MIEPTRRMVLVAAMGVGMAANKETLAWDFGFPSIDDGRLDFTALKGRVLRAKARGESGMKALIL